MGNPCSLFEHVFKLKIVCLIFIFMSTAFIYIYHCTSFFFFFFLCIFFSSLLVIYIIRFAFSSCKKRCYDHFYYIRSYVSATSYLSFSLLFLLLLCCYVCTHVCIQKNLKNKVRK